MWRVLILLFPFPAFADSLVATRVIRAQETLVAEAMTTVAAEIPGALSDMKEAVGLEARVAIYPGRPILAKHLGAVAVIERNQIVTLEYVSNGLAIRAEGRALARARPGDVIEVINLGSKAKVTGRVSVEGRVIVGLSAAP